MTPRCGPCGNRQMRGLGPVVQDRGRVVFRCETCGAATTWMPPGPEPRA